MAAPAKASKPPAVPAKPAAAKGAPAPVEPVPEKKEGKKKEKIPQKERPHSKKKHANVQIWKHYMVEGNKVTRKGEPCPRCGLGTFLATFKNRKYCGRCGWSQISK